MPKRKAPSGSSPPRSIKRQEVERNESPSDLFVAPYTPQRTVTPMQAPLQLANTVEFVQEQQEALRIILEGKNVFLTGEAGSGKTEVLKRAIEGLRGQGKHVRVTAPTGKAACGVGGRTLHNLLGLTPKKMQMRMDQLQDMVIQNEATRRSLEEMHVLIIEEISMVENTFFGRINRMIQTAKDNDDPFGGAQIIVCGDFRQLSPVKPFRYCFSHGGITTKKRGQDRKTMVWACPALGCDEERPESEQWAFLSEAWGYAEFTNINLTHNHRQSDSDFVGVLRKIARGEAPGRRGIDLLYHHPHDVKAATYLFPTNQEVRDMNGREFAKLHGNAETYRCFDHFWWDTRNEKYRYLGAKSPFGNTLDALHDHQYEPVLQLKVDQPVVLMTNLDVEKGLVNGSQGKIARFEPYDETKDHSGSGVDHSALETAALENTGSQASINIKGGENSKYRYLKVKEFCNHGRLLPVVEFNNGITTMILPDCSLTQVGNEYPYTLLSRTQMPLIAAWAMSVHKAQGMTMDNVVVDLSKAFCTGQAYVALSRARTLAGLKVEGSEAGLDKAAADPAVKQFMETTEWHTV